MSKSKKTWSKPKLEVLNTSLGTQSGVRPDASEPGKKMGAKSKYIS